MEAFYAHLVVSGDAFLEAVTVDGEVRELFVLRPDRMRPVKGPRGWPVAWEHGSEATCGASRGRRMGFCP